MKDLFLYGFIVGIIQQAYPFTLMIPLYNERQFVRCQEYVTCLENNIRHPMIKKIHVLYDTSQDTQEASYLLDYVQTKAAVAISYIDRRQTFADFFALANALYPNEPIIIANADIYFDETLCLLQGYDLTNKMLALTRWEIQEDGNIQLLAFFPFIPLRTNCQDVWILKTPINIPNAAIPIGTIGCDPYLAFQAAKVLEVINPCLSIRTLHLHQSNIRNYDKYATYDKRYVKELLLSTL